MKTFIYRGQRLPWTNNTGSTANPGQIVALNAGTTGFIGIVVDTTANGAQGVVEVEGVHQLAKNAGEAFTPGQQLYVNIAGQYLTGTSTSNTRAGRADVAYASAATLATCKINQA